MYLIKYCYSCHDRRLITIRYKTLRLLLDMIFMIENDFYDYS